LLQQQIFTSSKKKRVRISMVFIIMMMIVVVVVDVDRGDDIFSGAAHTLLAWLH